MVSYMESCLGTTVLFSWTRHSGLRGLAALLKAFRGLQSNPHFVLTVVSETFFIKVIETMGTMIWRMRSHLAKTKHGR